MKIFTTSEPTVSTCYGSFEGITSIARVPKEKDQEYILTQEA
jgi:hypothetical protein